MAAPIFQVLNSKAWGGLEMFAAELAESLVHDSGANVLTLAPADCELSRYFDAKKLAWLPAGRRLDQFFALRYWSKRNPQGIVVVQILRDLKWVRWALLGRKNRLMGFAHMMIGVNKKDPVHRWVYSRISKMICFSVDQRSNLLEHLPLEDTQVDVISHGVDLNRFQFHPRQDKDSSEPLVVGLVGRLDPQKGQRDLLEAMGLLKSEGLQVRLRLVGGETEGEQGEARVIKERAFAPGLSDHVEILPFHPDIEESFRTFDIFVMPSHRETFGRVLIEAMATGLPCVATKAGGVPSILKDQEEGLLVEPKNPVALAAALRRLLTSARDRQKFGQAARLRAEKDFDRQRQQGLFHEALFGKKGLHETGLP